MTQYSYLFVYLPLCLPAAGRVPGRRPQDLDGSRGIRRLGTHTCPDVRGRQQEGYPAPQDHTPSSHSVTACVPRMRCFVRPRFQVRRACAVCAWRGARACAVRPDWRGVLGAARLLGAVPRGVVLAGCGALWRGFAWVASARGAARGANAACGGAGGDELRVMSPQCSVAGFSSETELCPLRAAPPERAKQSGNPGQQPQRRSAAQRRDSSTTAGKPVRRPRPCPVWPGFCGC